MKTILTLLFILCIGAASYSQDIVGTWQGKLFVMGNYVRMVFHFKEDENKKLTATAESPDQSKKPLAVEDLEVNGDSLSMYLPDARADFSAKYNKDSAAYYGEISQRGFKFPVKLIKGDADDLLFKRPQKPVKPYPYKEEEVSIINKKGQDTLAGTLTSPQGNGKFPVAIMITGSGPEDRDETVFGHKPFLLISDYLTRKGFAVLRCDDRGTAKSTGDFSSATSADFASDVEAQIDYLKTRTDIDKKRIGLIGHSEGGLIAPMVASTRKDVAFIVLMAGPGINMFDLLLIQDSLVWVSYGLSDTQIQNALVTQKKVFHIVQASGDSASKANQIDSLLTAEKRGDREIEASIKQLLSPWMRWFVSYDVQAALKKVNCPVLAINGEKDIQVPAAVDIAAIENAMGKSADLKTAILPGLNHLFQHCTTCTVGEYVSIEETMNPIALSTIGDWMEKKVLEGKK